MSLFSDFLTTKTITVAGGLLATGGAVIAETVTDPTVGTGSFLLGGAGLIAAISAFTKDYWTDRQKQREHQVAILRMKLRNWHTYAALHELYAWARHAQTALPALPAVPDFRLDEDVENKTESGDG